MRLGCLSLRSPGFVEHSGYSPHLSEVYGTQELPAVPELVASIINVAGVHYDLGGQALSSPCKGREVEDPCP